MNLKAVYLDVEGTVYPGRDKGYESKHVRKSQEIAEKLFQRGIPVRFVTGRPAAYVEAVGQAVLGSLLNTEYTGTDAFPSVCECGGVFFYHFERRGEDVLRNRRSIKTLIYLEDSLYESFPGMVVEPGKDTMLSVNPPVDMDIEKFYSAVVDQVLATGLILRNKFGDYMQKDFNVSPKVDPESFIQITHSKSAVDITRGPVDKGSGLLKALQISRTRPEETLVIGDSWNDKPSMDVVKNIGIVGNARDDFKAWGRERGAIVAENPHIYGVEEILTDFELLDSGT